MAHAKRGPRLDCRHAVAQEHAGTSGGTVRSAALVGAGDYIGAAIARRFASEGFTVFAGRRHGEKLAPLVADIEARGGHAWAARSMRGRRKRSRRSFTTPTRPRPWRAAYSTSART